MNRREFVFSPALGLLWPSDADASSGFPSEPVPRALFPTPKEGATAGINPPGFAWWRAEGATEYRLTIYDARKRLAYQRVKLTDPVHLPEVTLPPGDYTWNVEAVDAKGRTIASRGARPFTVPEDVPELPWRTPGSLLARVPDSRPRYIFMADELPRIRESLRTTRKDAWQALKRRADAALKLSLPDPPEYHTYETRAQQRMGYKNYFRYLRGYIDGGMSSLALAFLLTGDEKYGLAAKKLFLEGESWGIEGPMSVLSEYGDEPGLSFCRHGQAAYDWLDPLFTESERERARKMTIGRARQMLERLRKADYLYTPGESHNGRMIAYLSEYAVVCKGEAPDAAEWLDYSLRSLMTFYPHWAGAEGGWAEGIGYALAYNTIYIPALESLRAATGLDLYQRPFYRRIRKFFLYCSSPIGEIKPFGDGAERSGVGSGGAVLMAHHGRRFKDPTAVWFAKAVGEGAANSGTITSLITEDNVEPEPPSELPSAEVFRGVGWAGLHSALDKPEEDTFFLFKSSPCGSVSHSHADQNSFAILKGGKALAIPSGHYSPAYGMPHHAEWTRSTQANNCVLVNGEGQVIRHAWANGKIEDYRHQQAITYLCGDATPAYDGKLSLFRRHVLFLRPAALLVVDELETPQPSQFQWLLHAFEKMALDPQQQAVVSKRAGAELEVRLSCNLGLDFQQTDEFATPVNEGNPPEYHVELPNHWHFTAATQKPARRAVIAAAMGVTGPGEKVALDWRGNKVMISTAEGEGELETNAGSPLTLRAVWRPRRGKVERFSSE